MKILHTADWHMKDRLGRIDRSDDILKGMRRIAFYLDEEDVDVMVVAGDLFREHCSREEIREAIADLKAIFQPFLQRGGTIIAISGNHDSATYFDTLYDTLDLATPTRLQVGDRDVYSCGGLYVAPKPDLIKLADKHGDIVQFVLLPYPDGRYLDVDQRPNSAAQRNLLIQNRYMEVLGYLQAQIDPHQPAVLVSHVYVRGTEVRAAYKLSEENDVIFEQSAIPSGWAYVAYGHIHKPQQAVDGAEHIRYAGSIERLDAGEKDDQKSVVLVEVGQNGRIGIPKLLALDPTPIYQIEIHDPDAELSLLPDPEKHADAANALVYYTVHWTPTKNGTGIDTIHTELRRKFPRWYGCDEVRYKDGAIIEPPKRIDLLEVRKNVTTYLEERLQKNPQRQELLRMADELLTQENYG
jgi:exonuclease SbcD